MVPGSRCTEGRRVERIRQRLGTLLTGRQEEEFRSVEVESELSFPSLSFCAVVAGICFLDYDIAIN